MIEFSEFPGISGRNKASAGALLRSLLPPHFLILHWPKQVTCSNLDSRVGETDFTAWWEFCKVTLQRCVHAERAFLQTIYHAPIASLNSSPCKDSLLHLAGSVMGLVGLHVSCFSCGKMKWLGGNKGKYVKCLKLPEGIVSITFPYLYKNKITHICIFDI